MKILKLYHKVNEKKLIFSLFTTLIFVYSFFAAEKIVKIIGLICIMLSIILVSIFILRLCKLRSDINNKSLEIRKINIKKIEHIKINLGIRHQFNYIYYGINIYTDSGKYILLYDEILQENDSFVLYKKIKKQKHIKVTYYKNSKVIKEVLTNI